MELSPLSFTLEEFLLRYIPEDMHANAPGSGLIGRIVTAHGKMLDFPKKDWREAGKASMRTVVRYTMAQWQSVGGFGPDCRNALHRAYDAAGLHFGMTDEQIREHETAANEDDSPTLSFQEYINTLKEFADNAGACAIGNEFTTEDGYKISIKVEKIKK